MKMIRNICKHVILPVLALATMTSCGMMTQEEPDCTPYYKARFVFNMNMLYADAFSTQVGEVDLYAFDTGGKLVWHGHEAGEKLAQEGYLMDLPLPAGTYDFVAWCRKRHDNAADFTMNGGDAPQMHTHLKMKLDRLYDGETAHSTTDLHALFHGRITNVELPDKWGTHVVTVPLTKDTNNIRIMLVHLSGKEIKAGDFDFRITDSNGHLAHDNSLLDDEDIEYRAWSKHEGMAQTVIPDAGVVTPPNAAPSLLSRAPQTSVHSLVAELTTSRLQTCRKPMLTVTRKSDGEPVIQIPIIDYFMMVKGEYHRPMDDDEYLDRQDEYNMTFFLHEDGSWYKAVVDILSWRVVLQNSDL